MHLLLIILGGDKNTHAAYPENKTDHAWAYSRCMTIPHTSNLSSFCSKDNAHQKLKQTVGD